MTLEQELSDHRAAFEANAAAGAAAFVDGRIDELALDAISHNIA